jgi:hypothetical protein
MILISASLEPKLHVHDGPFPLVADDRFGTYRIRFF